VEKESTLYNFIVLAIRVPNIITVGGILTKLQWKQFWLFLLRHGILAHRLLVFVYSGVFLANLCAFFTGASMETTKWQFSLWICFGIFCSVQHW